MYNINLELGGWQLKTEETGETGEKLVLTWS